MELNPDLGTFALRHAHRVRDRDPELYADQDANMDADEHRHKLSHFDKQSQRYIYVRHDINADGDHHTHRDSQSYGKFYVHGHALTVTGAHDRDGDRGSDARR